MYMAFPFLGCCVRMKVQEGFASIKSLLNIVEMRSDSLHGHSAEIRITWHLPVFWVGWFPYQTSPRKGECHSSARLKTSWFSDRTSINCGMYIIWKEKESMKKVTVTSTRISGA
jgi:hypothetical protein